MVLFDDLNAVEVIGGEMYMTCLYNFTRPLIRYHISDKFILHEAESGKKSLIVKMEDKENDKDKHYRKAI